MGSQILWSSCFFSLTLSSLPFHQATPIHQAILVLLLKPDKALQERGLEWPRRLRGQSLKIVFFWGAWNGRGGFVASHRGGLEWPRRLRGLLFAPWPFPGLSLDHLEIPQTSLRRAPQTKKWGLEGALLYQPLEEPWNQCL